MFSQLLSWQLNLENWSSFLLHWKKTIIYYFFQIFFCLTNFDFVPHIVLDIADKNCPAILPNSGPCLPHMTKFQTVRLEIFKVICDIECNHSILWGSPLTSLTVFLCKPQQLWQKPFFCLIKKESGLNYAHKAIVKKPQYPWKKL